jgi:cell division protein FtsZ
MTLGYELVDCYSDNAHFTVLGLGVNGSNTIDYLIAQGFLSKHEEITCAAIHSHADLLSESNVNHTFLIDPQQLALADIYGENESFNHYLLKLIDTLFEDTNGVFIVTDFREEENIKLVSAINRVWSKNRTDSSAFIIAIINQPALEEGKRLQEQFNQGKTELLKYCNTTIVNSTEMILNNLADENKPLSSYFNQEFKASYQSLKVIIYPINFSGLIGCDIADIRTIVYGKRVGFVVTGQSKGENRAEQAAKQAIKKVEQEWGFCNTEISGVLVLLSAAEMSLTELDLIATFIDQKYADTPEIKITTAVDDEKGDQLEVNILLVKESDFIEK